MCASRLVLQKNVRNIHFAFRGRLMGPFLEDGLRTNLAFFFIKIKVH
jgi:hypothetical protein